MNTENLYNRLAKEETESVVAIADMAFGGIYQSQSDLNYYTWNKFTGYVMCLRRDIEKWEKLRGISFSWMMSQKWKRVQDASN